VLLFVFGLTIFGATTFNTTDAAVTVWIPGSRRAPDSLTWRTRHHDSGANLGATAPAPHDPAKGNGICERVDRRAFDVRLQLEMNPAHYRWERVLQGVGYGLFLVPVNIIAYSQLRPDQNNKASSLTNLLRNWGG
jgi:hypothetical protein